MADGVYVCSRAYNERAVGVRVAAQSGSAQSGGSEWFRVLRVRVADGVYVCSRAVGVRVLCA